jgi:hypothetical protein
MKNTQISIAKLEIGNAASEAVRVIAHAAEEAAKVVAAAAAESTKSSNKKNNDDHDVLITFRAETQTELRGIRSDIQKLTDGTATQINDHEIRLNTLETSKTKQNTMMAIGVGILTLLTSLLVYHLIGK